MCFSMARRAALGSYRRGTAGAHRVPPSVGRFTTASPSEPAAAAVLRPRILYGSQTGTAAMLAMELGEALSSAGFSPSVIDLRDFSPDALLAGTSTADVPPTFLLLSCLGRGEATDSAKAFVASWLASSRPSAACERLRFAVFGLGSSKTHKEYYNIVGRSVDTRLAALGGTRLLPLTLGDASSNLEDSADAFKAGVLDVLTHLRAAAASSDSAGVKAAAVPQSTPMLRNPYHSENCALTIIPACAPCDGPAPPPRPGVLSSVHALSIACGFPLRALRVAGVTLLTEPGEFRPVYELRLSLAGSSTALPYAAGDHIVVMPQNTPSDVDALCAAMKWDPEFAFSLSAADSNVPASLAAIGAPRGGPSIPQAVATVREVLTHSVAISAPLSPSMLRHLSAFASDPKQASALAALAEPGQFGPRVKEGLLRVLDLVSLFPTARLPLDRFLTSCPPLLPRYYSISTSPLHPGGELHVSFRHVRLPRADGSVFLGAATSFMASRAPGDDVLVAVRPSSFKLPPSLATPVVFIAGGVGITPFRSFVQERLARAAASTESPVFGAALLLYGCRDGADCVYDGVFRDALCQGALSAYDVAFAAPSKKTLARTPRPRLAHELILEHADDVWNTMRSDDGVLFVCGGAAGFGEAVSGACKQIMRDRMGGSAERAEEAFTRLLKSDRFIEDLAD